MSDAGGCTAPCIVGDPLSKDGAVHKRVVPHRHSDVRNSERQLLNRVPRYKRHRAGGQRLYAMIRDAQQRILQIDYVAAHVDRAYRTPAIAHELLPECETGKE